MGLPWDPGDLLRAGDGKPSPRVQQTIPGTSLYLGDHHGVRMV
jgi:hypothetical protein